MGVYYNLNKHSNKIVNKKRSAISLVRNSVREVITGEDRRCEQKRAAASKPQPRLRQSSR